MFGAEGPDVVDVLPKWNRYTVGYATDGRERLAHPDVQGRAYTSAGDGLVGVVLVDGAACVLRKPSKAGSGR